MITEDYVSFETAKLLKEKGFDEYCRFIYSAGVLCSVASLDCHWNEGYGELIEERQNSDFGKYDNAISAPTLQMTMKWLREEKGIAVIPIISSVLDNEKFLWDVKVVVAETNDTYSQGWVYEKQEDACERAVQYCLENLIKTE